MQVGIIGEAKLFPAIYEFRIVVHQKGFSNNITTSVASGHIRINYLEVPLNLAFKVGGPFDAVRPGRPVHWLRNHAKNVFEDSSNEPVKIEFGDGTFNLKRLDYGAISVRSGDECPADWRQLQFWNG